MILTESTLARVNITEMRLKLALALKVTEQAIIRYISKNEIDGPLTTATATNLIKKETGLTDSEILMEEKQPATIK